MLSAVSPLPIKQANSELKQLFVERGATNILSQMWYSGTVVSMGLDFALALDSSRGEVFAWGNNDSGQCNIPESIKDRRDVVMISAALSANYSMVLFNDGTIGGWGEGTRGKGNQLDIPPGIQGKVVAISAGTMHVMALLDDGTVNGTVRCWGGFNSSGELNVPEIRGRVTAISAGSSHSMALLEDGTVQIWGSNVSGQCDVSRIQGKVSKIIAGIDQSFVILENGKVIQLGSNTLTLQGKVIQLGSNTLTLPDEINALKHEEYLSSPRVSCISVVPNYGVAVLDTDTNTNTNNVICWSSRPSSITKIPPWVQGKVAMACVRRAFSAFVGDDSCVVATLVNGKVVAWGSDKYKLCSNIPPEILGKEDSFSSLSPQMTSTAAAFALSPQMTSTAAAVNSSSERDSEKCFNCGNQTQYDSLYCEKCKSGTSGGYSFLQYFHHCY